MARLEPFSRACAGTRVDPLDLYRWAGTVTLALFDDLAVVEIALRSAMARELAETLGIDWYRQADIFDDGTLSLIDRAWRAGRLENHVGTADVLHGKLVASLMFGFWVKLLGRGTYGSEGGERRRRIYDTTLWKPVLRKAFPQAGDLDRAVVENSARRVQILRNRIAHHEQVVWGVPLAGEKSSDGAIVRLTVREAHATLLNLAGFVDTDLASWLADYSRVDRELRRCPIPDQGRLRL